MEILEEKKKLRCYLSNKINTTLYLIHSSSNQGSAFELENRQSTTARYSIFVEWPNLSLVPVPPLDRFSLFVAVLILRWG